MERGIADYEATGAKLRLPYFLGLLADQLNKTGRVEEGLLAISKALNLIEHTGEQYLLAEWHRIKGEMLMKSGERNAPVNDSRRSTAFSQARGCFADALAIAQKQGARSWELRAALRMYGLDRMLGKPDHSQLAGIFSSFTEGYKTADLRQARACLEVAPLE